MGKDLGGMQGELGWTRTEGALPLIPGLAAARRADLLDVQPDVASAAEVEVAVFPCLRAAAFRSRDRGWSVKPLEHRRAQSAAGLAAPALPRGAHRRERARLLLDGRPDDSDHLPLRRLGRADLRLLLLLLPHLRRPWRRGFHFSIDNPEARKAEEHGLNPEGQNKSPLRCESENLLVDFILNLGLTRKDWSVVCPPAERIPLG